MVSFIYTNSCDFVNLWEQNPLSNPINSTLPPASNQSQVIPSVNAFQQKEIDATKFIRIYLLMIIYVIGVVGNGLSLTVLLRKRMARVSTYIYLAVLSVFDTVILTTGLLQTWLEELKLVSSKTHSNVGCKLTKLASYVISDSSVWLIISVTAERFIAVCYPLKAASMCRRKIAMKIIIIIILFFFVFNMHFLWTTELVVSTFVSLMKI